MFNCQEIIFRKVPKEPSSARGLVGMQENINIVRDTNPGECVNTLIPELQQGIRNIREPCCFISPGYRQTSQSSDKSIDNTHASKTTSMYAANASSPQGTSSINRRRTHAHQELHINFQPARTPSLHKVTCHFKQKYVRDFECLTQLNEWHGTHHPNSHVNVPAVRVLKNKFGTSTRYATVGARAKAVRRPCGHNG